MDYDRAIDALIAGEIDVAIFPSQLDTGRVQVRNGGWAARGVPSEAFLKQWLRHSYFARKPPKSTGRELFGEPFWLRILPRLRKAALSKFDVLAMLSELTARSIALNYRLHLETWPQTVILTGGGAANPALLRSIRAALAAYAPATELHRLSPPTQ